MIVDYGPKSFSSFDWLLQHLFPRRQTTKQSNFASRVCKILLLFQELRRAKKNMGKERRKSTPVCLAAAFLITCQLVQTTASLRMTKTERRAAQKAFDVDVQEGEILFGDVSEEDSHVTDGTWKASSNSSGEDETSYQADFAG